MTEDATLPEFLGDESGERDADDGTGSDVSRETDGGSEANGRTGADEHPGPGRVEPVRPTYAWGEYACDRCGERTDRAWREEGGLVCPGCKPW